MKPVRYVLLALLALAPVLVFGQLRDSVHVDYGGVEYPGYGAAFGAPFILGEKIGLFRLIPVAGDGTTPAATPEQGCDPLANADAVAGKIAFIVRGVCPFTTKVQNAAAAGAVAALVYNDDRVPDDDDTFIIMGGNCTPQEGCSIPAAFFSRAGGLAMLNTLNSPILSQFRGGVKATIIPIRVVPPEEPRLPFVAGEREVKTAAVRATAPEGTFGLGAAYPNPFSARTTLAFTLPTAQRARLAVYDVLGREVAVLVDGVRPAGEQAVGFDAAGLPSGVYLYRLEAGGTVLTQRLTLVR